MSTIKASNLDFGYPERPVGRDVSISAQAGEVLCLLGPNGCGKTTLFRTLLGLLPAQGGEVRLGDARLDDLSRQEIARRIAYVPQSTAAAFPYTALDLVLMGRVAHSGPFTIPSPADRAVATRALENLGIANLANREITRLSGGQRQLVMVARAIAQAAPIVVMDEPTASLDFGNQVMVLSMVRSLAARGMTVILSTHAPDQAFAVADRAALMKDGHLIGHGTPAEVLTSARLKDVYGVNVTVARLTSGQTVVAPAYDATRGSDLPR